MLEAKSSVQSVRLHSKPTLVSAGSIFVSALTSTLPAEITFGWAVVRVSDDVVTLVLVVTVFPDASTVYVAVYSVDGLSPVNVTVLPSNVFPSTVIEVDCSSASPVLQVPFRVKDDGVIFVAPMLLDIEEVDGY